jgi:pimeloyl-ACP methyl ester carboxylesterase
LVLQLSVARRARHLKYFSLISSAYSKATKVEAWSAKLIPVARLIEFAGKGHGPQVDVSVGFNKVLVEELNRS